MNTAKLSFLQNDVVRHLRALDENTPPLFGKMNVRQMIEHMSYSVRVASGKLPLPVRNAGEVLEKSYTFMMSEKPFRPGTPNPNLPDEPEAPRQPSKEAAIAELEAELADFHAAFTQNADKRIDNPFFGQLNYAEQVHLLDKHFRHHFRQFGVEV